MSYLNGVLEGLDGVPAYVVRTLAELRELDKTSNAETVQLAKDEASLLEAVRQAGKQNPEFDEDPFKSQFDVIMRRRVAVQSLLEKQSKLAQSIYEHLDQKIFQFGDLVISW